jgi:hypothetical protein
MAEENRTFNPSRVEANRAAARGLGVGQKEMDLQLDPGREKHATDPQRLEPFDTHLDAGPRLEHTPEVLPGATPDVLRAEAETDEADDPGKPWLGEGVPQNVDPHDTGDQDNPQNDWGDPADPGALHGANHTRRPLRTEAERGQGAKTRRLNKDIISRRA